MVQNLSKQQLLPLNNQKQMQKLYLKITLVLITTLFITTVHSQSITEIRFNLYYDSLKTTIDNYINVEAKLSNGRYLPLTEKDIQFSSDYGFWRGSALVLSKERANMDKVNITAQLKSDTSKKISATIYVQKYPDAGIFLTEQDYMNRIQNRNRQAPPRKQPQQRRMQPRGFYW